MPTGAPILTINGGSSSIKVAFLERALWGAMTMRIFAAHFGLKARPYWAQQWLCDR